MQTNKSHTHLLTLMTVDSRGRRNAVTEKEELRWDRGWRWTVSFSLLLCGTRHHGGLVYGSYLLL